MTDALRITVTAPVVSFRNPLFAGVQVSLPCPPPATVGGLLAAAAGGWHRVDPSLRFAMAFRARGHGVDVETYYPLDATGRATDPAPRDRDSLADARLTVWILDDPPNWQRTLRRPYWPLRLGRSQDLIGIKLDLVELRQIAGRQGDAVLPASAGTVGTVLQLPTAISLDRHRTRWGIYRYATTDTATATVTDPDAYTDDDGQAVVLLPPTHPSHADRQPS
jgi:CRISPR-associated protein Cas5t